MFLAKINQSNDWVARYLFPLLLLSIPFSVAVDVGTTQINLPSEPLIALLAVLLVFKVDWRALPKSALLRQPISIAAICYLSWGVLTLPFSSVLTVSVKYLLVSVAHWWVFYAGFFYFARQSGTRIIRWLSYYAVGFACVIFYAWYVHAQYSFRIDASVLAARPFYSDHTLYATAMALLVFVFGMEAVRPAVLSENKIWQRSFNGLLALLFLVGIYLSFCRAAWLSVLLSSGLGLWIRVFKIRFWVLVLSLFTIGGVAFFGLPKLLPHLQENTTESKKGNWLDQVKSIGNVTNDVSNLERLNRYSCAWRMFLDRPVTGFGAGNFESAYLPYQRPEEMTRLSVTTFRAADGGPHPSGRGGGAHSEYLQALAETGLPGLMCWLALVGSAFYTGMKIYYRDQRQSHRRLAMALLLGLTTFFIHTLFNNFLHSDKIAVLFWAMLAALALLDADLKTAQD